MAKKQDEVSTKRPKSEADDITSDLIKDLNKQFQSRVAFNLSEDAAPTVIKRWISTGSVLLDYIVSNRRDGGMPEGRIVEISGMPSTGKSHIAFLMAKHVQAMGGLVVYIDTENAVPVDKLAAMGIDVRKRFVYCDTHCTEEVFSIIESTITKAKAVMDKDIPILVVWDSVAATSPKAELEGEYDQNSVGLQARTISKGMRKITGVIGQNNVTLVCLNQLRSAIGVTHGDPMGTPGGNAIPFHSSVRIRLGSGYPVKDKAGNVIGIHVTVSIKKNKVALPFRKCEFDIHFGHGIVEHEFLFDELRSWCDANKAAEAGGKLISISGTGAWKELKVSDSKTGEVLQEKKFYKSEFNELWDSAEYGPVLRNLAEKALTIDLANYDPKEAEPGENDDD